jgi:hypothetical protein
MFYPPLSLFTHMYSEEPSLRRLKCTEVETGQRRQAPLLDVLSLTSFIHGKNVQVFREIFLFLCLLSKSMLTSFGKIKQYKTLFYSSSTLIVDIIMYNINTLDFLQPNIHVSLLFVMYIYIILTTWREREIEVNWPKLRRKNRVECFSKTKTVGRGGDMTAWGPYTKKIPPSTPFPPS